MGAGAAPSLFRSIFCQIAAGRSPARSAVCEVVGPRPFADGSQARGYGSAGLRTAGVAQGVVRQGNSASVAAAPVASCVAWPGDLSALGRAARVARCDVESQSHQHRKRLVLLG